MSTSFMSLFSINPLPGEYRMRSSESYLTSTSPNTSMRPGGKVVENRHSNRIRARLTFRVHAHTDARRRR